MLCPSPLAPPPALATTQLPGRPGALINMIPSSSSSAPDFAPPPPPPAGSQLGPENNASRSPSHASSTAKLLGLATLLAQFFTSVAIAPVPAPPASTDSFVSAELNLSADSVPAAAPAPAPPIPAPAPRRRHNSVALASPPAFVRRQSTRLAAMATGSHVDMTDKAVKRKALQNSLAACSPAVQHHVQRRGLLSRNKLPIALPDIRKLARAAGLDCSTKAVVDAVSPTPI